MTRFVRGILWTAIVLAAINLLLPFVGPAIGFGMGPDPAFVITEARVVRHVIPDSVVILGALLMLYSGSRMTRVWGGIAALLAAGWVAVGPHVLQVESVSQLIRRLTYHSLTGVVLIALAGVALGALVASRVYDLRAEAARSESERVGV